MGAQQSVDGESNQGTFVPVTLHVYDLGRKPEITTMNDVLAALGTGAFHCGVEVHGWEFSFNFRMQGSGVFQCLPMSCLGHTYRTSVFLGHTSLSPAQVEKKLIEFRREWQGTSYDLIRRNCCHFSDEFACALGVGSIPSWTRNLSGAAAKLVSACDAVVGFPYTVEAAFDKLGTPAPCK
mmetsp:Transcript_56011/g.122434  ORF Transcript_56011/g.122434 Transcript_56011/m.122434 type:complete len:180 (+) Transcript_56011:304-843(+)